MMRFFFLTCIYFNSVIFFAQSIQDGLGEKFNNLLLYDTAEVNRFNSLAYRYRNINSDSTFYYSTKALSEAIKLKYPLGIAQAYLTLGEYNFTNLNDSKKSFYYFNNAQILLKYLLQSQTITDSLKLKQKLADSFIGMGLNKQQFGEYKDALMLFNEALIIGNSIHDENIIAKSLNNFALIYNDLADRQRAIEYAFKSLKIKEKLNDNNSRAKTLSLISAIYGGTYDYDNSLKYALSSLSLMSSDSSSSKPHFISTTINVAIIYAIRNKFNLADLYFDKALKAINKYNIKSALPGYYNELGNFYAQQGKDTKAIECYLLALKFNENKKQTSNAFFNLGVIYFKQDNYNESLKNTLESLGITKSIGSDINKIKLRKKLIIQNYEKLNNPKKALEYSIDLINNLDSFASKSNIQNLEKIKAIYDFEKTVFLEKEKRKLNEATFKEQINAQKLIQNGLIVLTILLVIIFALITINYKNKANAKQQIVKNLEENHQSIVKNMLSEQELKSLQNIISGQEIERNRIAIELHDGIGGSLAGIKLKLTSLNENKNPNDIELKNVISNVDLVYQEIRSISHNLLPPQLTNTSYTVVINKLIDEYRTNSNIIINVDYLDSGALNQINQDLQVILYRITQELLKNAISHSKCSLIEININNYKNNITLVFEDNGIGFNNNEKSFGIGLRNIQSRVNSINGSLIIDSKIGRGSAFYISVNI